MGVMKQMKKIRNKLSVGNSNIKVSVKNKTVVNKTGNNYKSVKSGSNAKKKIK